MKVDDEHRLIARYAARLAADTNPAVSDPSKVQDSPPVTKPTERVSQSKQSLEPEVKLPKSPSKHSLFESSRKSPKQKQSNSAQLKTSKSSSPSKSPKMSRIIPKLSKISSKIRSLSTSDSAVDDKGIVLVGYSSQSELNSSKSRKNSGGKKSPTTQAFTSRYTKIMSESENLFREQQKIAENRLYKNALMSGSREYISSDTDDCRSIMSTFSCIDNLETEVSKSTEVRDVDSVDNGQPQAINLYENFRPLNQISLYENIKPISESKKTCGQTGLSGKLSQSDDQLSQSGGCNKRGKRKPIPLPRVGLQNKSEAPKPQPRRNSTKSTESEVSVTSEQGKRDESKTKERFEEETTEKVKEVKSEVLPNGESQGDLEERWKKNRKQQLQHAELKKVPPKVRPKPIRPSEFEKNDQMYVNMVFKDKEIKREHSMSPDIRKLHDTITKLNQGETKSAVIIRNNPHQKLSIGRDNNPNDTSPSITNENPWKVKNHSNKPRERHHSSSNTNIYHYEDYDSESDSLDEISIISESMDHRLDKEDLDTTTDSWASGISTASDSSNAVSNNKEKLVGMSKFCKPPHQRILLGKDSMNTVKAKEKHSEKEPVLSVFTPSEKKTDDAGLHSGHADKQQKKKRNFSLMKSQSSHQIRLRNELSVAGNACDMSHVESILSYHQKQDKDQKSEFRNPLAYAYFKRSVSNDPQSQHSQLSNQNLSQAKPIADNSTHASGSHASQFPQGYKLKKWASSGELASGSQRLMSRSHVNHHQDVGFRCPEIWTQITQNMKMLSEQVAARISRSNSVTSCNATGMNGMGGSNWSLNGQGSMETEPEKTVLVRIYTMLA